MNFKTGPQHLSLGLPDGHGNGASEAVPSAAWLAAQGAFCAVETKRSVASPVVIVRKVRNYKAAEIVVKTQSISPSIKSPRIFRVGDVKDKSGDILDSRATVGPASVVSAPVAQTSHDRRPSAQKSGPVRQVYRAKPPAEQPAPIASDKLILSQAQVISRP